MAPRREVLKGRHFDRLSVAKQWVLDPSLFARNVPKALKGRNSFSAINNALKWAGFNVVRRTFPTFQCSETMASFIGATEGLPTFTILNPRP